MRRSAWVLLLVGAASCTPDRVDAPSAPSAAPSAPSAARADPPPLASSPAPPATTAAPAPVGSATAVAEVPRPPPAPRVLETLRDNAVYHGAVARKVLYTWTNGCHLADMRQIKRLLYRTDLPGIWKSRLDERLRLRSSDPVASMLSRAPFRHRRPAWPTSWGARMPLIKELGGVLLRVELRDEAIIAVLDSELKGRWRFVRAAGHPVDRATALANPHEIAAIYEVWHGDDDEPEPADQSPFAYRQYVLLNESMIASVEAGTASLKQTLARDVEYLEAMATYVEGLNETEPPFETWKVEAAAAWAQTAPDDDPLTLWNAAAPSADSDHIPEGERITELRHELNRMASFSEPPLRLQRRVPFGAPPQKPPPRRWSLDPTTVFDECPD